MTEGLDVTRIAAIVVTFKPNLAVLGKLLDAIAPQVDMTIVVDNGSGSALAATMAARRAEREVFLPLGENQGIAAAQNAGIEKARSEGMDHVILFDHDSAPSADMVQALRKSLLRLEAEGRHLASIGPCYLDDRQNNPPPFIRVRGLSLARCLEPETGDAVSVDYLIASGCLIPMRVFDDVGMMNTDLFIDYVDIEWGQRARSKGYENFGCFSAHMRHSLGDDPISFFGTSYPVRSPLRHYYMFRNAVLLYRMKHIPSDWKWADGLRGVLRFWFYLLFAKPRLQHLKMMCLGLWHGVCGRTGPFRSRA